MEWFTEHWRDVIPVFIIYLLVAVNQNLGTLSNQLAEIQAYINRIDPTQQDDE